MGSESAKAAPSRGRNTRQKRVVEQLLLKTEDFVSAQELFLLIQQSGQSVSLATVYRILQGYAQEGLVDVLRSDEGEALYRMCEEEGHHHHLICRSCGACEEIQDSKVESWAQRIATQYGYTQPGHTVEFSGLCPQCSSA